MFITLSEARNEKLLCEWSGEITDRHAQDFCDVCNVVLRDHFDLDYMWRKYEANFYGKSFFVVVYKDDKPVAAWGAWRNDLDKKTAFQLCDFATLPEARKSGYFLDMYNFIHEEIKKAAPDAWTYGFPGAMAYKIMKVACTGIIERYMRLFTGASKDFLENMPLIDDNYVENFLCRGKKFRVKKIHGKYYVAMRRRIKRLIPAYLFLGEINSKYANKIPGITGPKFSMYYSLTKGSLFGSKRQSHTSFTAPEGYKHINEILIPFYKVDSYTLEFNGINKN